MKRSDPNQRIHLSNEDKNTPMYCVLQELNHNQQVEQKSGVLSQQCMMFWMGYLFKKVHQNRCE